MIFKKIKINKTNLKNRVIVSPMCQYSGSKGSPTNWHYQHLGKLALSGAGMMMIESTAVNKTGMITNKDLALYNKTQENKFKELIKFINNISNIPIGIQISHSGRKGSTHVPWIKPNTPLSKKKNGWNTVAPSAIKKDKKWPTPLPLTSLGIKKIKEDFKKSVIRAKNIGFDCLEVHMAHGYLLHQFFSPISNKREDKYGGSLENRSRLLLEIAKIIRNEWPKNKILGARITGDDHLENGINIKDSIYLSKELKKIGFDYLCISSGGIITKTKMKFSKGFRLEMSKKIKLNTNIKIRTSGQINEIKFANKIIKNNKCDFVAVGRKFLLDPNWLQKSKNISTDTISPQYRRGLV